MEIVIQVLQVVTPVFLVVATGALWAKSGREFPIDFVTQLATKLAVPALIIVVLMQSELDEQAVSSMIGASFVAYGAAMALFAGVLLALALPRRVYLAPMTFGNTGNLGLPLALFAFGEAGLELAIVVFAVTSILVFSLGIALVSGSFAMRRLISEPIFCGTVIGTTLLYTGLETPIWATNFLELIGQLAIPLVLITLGVSLARLNGSNFVRAGVLSLMKITLCAAIGWTVAQMFGLSDLQRAVLILQLATPVAVTSYMLAQLYGSEPQEVATLVIASTGLSVLTLPILLSLLL
ncbi:MAG: AEC family transporter [Pseudomonadota bacterium]